MIYLDNAATSWPKPPEVLRAVNGVMSRPFGNPGRGGHRASLCAGRVVYACREAAARYLGCAPERVIFTLNCTDALNMAIRGCLHRGDHVLATHDAHNAVMRPLAGMEQRGEISLSILRAGEGGVLDASAIDEAVTPQTRLCILTHASNVTGTLQLPGIAGLLQGIRFASANQAAIHQYECELIDELRAQLSAIDGVTVYGRAEDAHVGVLSFNLSGMDSSELADALDARGLCLRGGLHCAPCMHRYLGTQGTVRASVGPYSTLEEMDILAAEVQAIRDKT